MCAKKYENWLTVDRATATIKWLVFLVRSVQVKRARNSTDAMNIYQAAYCRS